MYCCLGWSLTSWMLALNSETRFIGFVSDSEHQSKFGMTEGIRVMRARPRGRFSLDQGDFQRTVSQS